MNVVIGPMSLVYDAAQLAWIGVTGLDMRQQIQASLVGTAVLASWFQAWRRSRTSGR